jgi:hypothetical protein
VSNGDSGSGGLPNFRFTLKVNIGPSNTRPVVVSKFINMPPAIARVRNLVASKAKLNGTPLTVTVGLIAAAASETLAQPCRSRGQKLRPRRCVAMPVFSGVQTFLQGADIGSAHSRSEISMPITSSPEEGLLQQNVPGGFQAVISRPAALWRVYLH